LLLQALAVSAPPMDDFADARDAAQTLARLLGPSVVVCAQLDDSRAPATPHPCNDRCPLCQAGAGAFAFVVPAPAPALAPTPRLFGALVFPPTARAPPRGPYLIALARGPPALI
jgi:hypothetical protein